MSKNVEGLTPVIIPACKAESTIARTLDSLRADVFEPIVAVNGAADRTTDIAEHCGAAVLFSEQGKLPAIQAALTYLGRRALAPLLILDADSRPLLPLHWRNGMIGRAAGEDSRIPKVIGGPVVFTGDHFFENTIRTARRINRAKDTRSNRVLGSRASQYGPSMALNISHEDILDKILALDNFWPGEDRALGDTIEYSGGLFDQPTTPNLLVLTPASKSYLSYSERKQLGVEEARKRVDDYYRRTAPPNSRPYVEPEF